MPPAIAEMYRIMAGQLDGRSIPLAGLDHWRERKARADALVAEQRLLTGLPPQASLPAPQDMDLGTWRGGQENQPPNW